MHVQDAPEQEEEKEAMEEGGFFLTALSPEEEEGRKRDEVEDAALGGGGAEGGVSQGEQSAGHQEEEQQQQQRAMTGESKGGGGGKESKGKEGGEPEELPAPTFAVTQYLAREGVRVTVSPSLLAHLQPSPDVDQQPAQPTWDSPRSKRLAQLRHQDDSSEPLEVAPKAVGGGAMAKMGGKGGDGLGLGLGKGVLGKREGRKPLGTVTASVLNALH
eukprot:2830482-Rhodomonas_salina.1